MRPSFLRLSKFILIDSYLIYKPELDVYCWLTVINHLDGALIKPDWWALMAFFRRSWQDSCGILQSLAPAGLHPLLSCSLSVDSLRILWGFVEDSFHNLEGSPKDTSNTFQESQKTSSRIFQDAINPTARQKITERPPPPPPPPPLASPSFLPPWSFQEIFPRMFQILCKNSSTSRDKKMRTSNTQKETETQREWP